MLMTQTKRKAKMIKQSIFCPAKINLHLEILDKRADGYHDVDTVMQSVTLCDKVSVSAQKVENNGKITVSCDNKTVPQGENSHKNIVYKAALLYLEQAALDPDKYDIAIDIEKQIPVCAGLAGGSTDAAGVLILLDIMLEVYMGRDAIAKFAGKIGADVPFCVLGGAYRCTGIGDQLERVNSLSTELFICIAKGADKESTAHAYALMDARQSERRLADHLIEALEREDLVEIGASLYNAFHLVNDNEGVNKAISQMRRCGALGASLSGSGPSVFGIFYSIDDAEAAMNSLVAMGYEAFVASPVR